MKIIKFKKFKSIDGFVDQNLKYIDIKKINFLEKYKSFSFIGKGNSISGLPYDNKSLLINYNIEDKFEFDKKKSELSVNGNIEVYKIHNYLLKKKLYFPSFPSYSNVTAAACIANCVHGLNPKMGIIKDFVKEIKIYNPNFGFKTLSLKKNKKLFFLTIGGMGLTGLIINIKFKTLKLISSNLKIEKNKEFTDLIHMYKYLLNNNYFYNQNNIFIDLKKGKVLGRFSSGNLSQKKINLQFISIKNINSIRLGFFKFTIFKKLFEKLILFKEQKFKKLNIHINDAFYPSNSRLIYFNLMDKKFIEYQSIIPHHNVVLFLKDLKVMVDKHSPLISLCHLKIFNGKSHYLQFDGKGLALSIHLTVNTKFNSFYKKLNNLNHKYNGKINIYKNSLVKIKDIKKSYGKNYDNFKREIIKLNHKFIIVNRIFNNKDFYKKR
jgi:decaprenylphospho-beta-D-ribofuranose 2-oxidase